MSTEALVILVLTVTQVGKSWLQKWVPKLDWKAWMSVVLSLILSFGVVGYSYINASMAFDLWPFLTLGLTVFVIANGGKKLIGSVASKIRK